MVDMIMDVLRALSSPNQDIRRKTLDIVLDLITPRNINEVVLTLKKEVVKTQSGSWRKMASTGKCLFKPFILVLLNFLKLQALLYGQQEFVLVLYGSLVSTASSVFISITNSQSLVRDLSIAASSLRSENMEKSCSLLVHFDKGTPALANEIKEALEGNDDTAKIEAMEKAIMLLLNGETIPRLFITIIRYVLPSEDHTVQKLLLLYLENIEKTDSQGKILPEMILICQNLRNNLQHPNEYIRGVTLRFLHRIRESEIIEPLIPSILANLEHRNPYVRRNAILAVNAIYKLPQGDHLLVDAPEMIEKLLSTEADPSAKRNAFLFEVESGITVIKQCLGDFLLGFRRW
ncbi:hypothetical protein QVD17_37243 [Tagetes erecta]|uniref:Clathrin/coatomer adaptor adaptin-like N-terminal domain-containing protein n=1 Tax=Tagetes erecta TaxID=13708 RepID=A0AAD8NI55_TARER|nr:hypothetical protein QVD17_37243 [Tagetes erecta]